MTLLAWFVVFLLDSLLGDPPHWPHPVRWIGNLITVLQRAIRRICHSERAPKLGGGPAVGSAAVCSVAPAMAWRLK